MNRPAASRYARSLLDVAVAEGQSELVSEELAGFVALMDRTPELRRVLVNPGIPATRKHALVAAVVERAGTMPMVGKLLVMLAERDRISLIPDVVDIYRERLLERQETVRAEVTTAAPLGMDRADALRNSLAEATGKRVMLDFKIDPAIIGGVVTRIGSTVYDGSVVRQLERIKERLTQI